MKRILKAFILAWVTKKLFNRVARADDDADTARRGRR
jgi:uncharacterized damage-inducible protein DinB